MVYCRGVERCLMSYPNNETVVQFTKLTMHIILTVKNRSPQRKTLEQAIYNLTEQYGEFEGSREVASLDGELIVHILDAPNALLNQEDVQTIAGSIQTLVIED